MAKSHKEAYDLSDAEKRDLIALIQAGKPLPEKYRFILFEDKREVELVWNGKTREVCTTILPFQSLEHIDEPRKEKRDDEEFAFDTRGRQSTGWTNKLIWGDNKLILSSLKSGALRRQIEEAGGLKLIYIDPPFDVGADFSMDIEIGDETFHKEANLLEQIAYRDTWGRGADSFIAMIYERLILMRDLMAPDGCIYVHCDWHVGFALRSVLNEIFGAENFINEIVWHYYNKMAPSSACFPRASDRILSYSKTRGQYDFYQQYEQLDKPVQRLKRQFVGGRAINVRDADGNVQYIELDKKRLDDVWRISMLQPADKTEYLAYRTQKPEVLVERILQASSNEGDLVADFFCGSGTTAAVAEKLGRKWIATDLGKFAIHTTRKRLIQVQRELKPEGKPFRAFEVLNLGRYERQAYLNVGGRLTGRKKEAALAQKEREFRDLILKAYKAQPLEGDAFFHGKNAGRLVVVGPINLPVGRLFVEETIVECRKRGATRADILAFEFEMGLFPAVLDEAKAKGIDLAPKYIPAEVFDKRAVEKGQVVFHDVSFIEVKPVYDKKDKLKIRVELTDFSVYYTQGIVDALAADLKEGKSEVVCEGGKLIKVSKDKAGVVKREVLTKEWTDWVDYWAVDFDYQSRKEMVKVARNFGAENQLPGVVDPREFIEFDEHWTGGYIFENEWQSFRTRKDRNLELMSAAHAYEKAGRYVVAVKVIDIFGNDTMTLMPLTIS